MEKHVCVFIADNAIDRCTQELNNMKFNDACYAGHIEIVKLLLNLELPSSPMCCCGDIYTDTPYHIIDVHSGYMRACMKGHIEIAKLLLSLEGSRKLKHYISCGNLCFHKAWRGHHIEIVNLLLSLNSEMNINLHINDAHFNQRDYHNKYHDKLHIDGEGFCTLCHVINIHTNDKSFRSACCDNKIEEVKFILEHSSYRDFSNESLPCLKELLENHPVQKLQLIWNNRIQSCDFYLNDKEKRILDRCKWCAWKLYENHISITYKPGSKKMLDE